MTNNWLSSASIMDAASQQLVVMQAMATAASDMQGQIKQYQQDILTALAAILAEIQKQGQKIK